jgi:Uma2 family endonuclease
MSMTNPSQISIEANVASVPTDLIWRLTLEKYHDMVRAGALTEDDPVEFLEGWLVYKMPKNRQHSLATARTRKSLERVVPEQWYVESQEPITMEDSEPEPDVSVIRGSADSYPHAHPGPGDVTLVVEVADATLDRDRGWKKRLYARVRIPVYWIVNLLDRCVEVYTGPSGPTAQPDYGTREVYDDGQQIPLVIEATFVAQVAAKDLLP